MKILVTGGAGFIGSHLIDDLIVEGHNVIVYDSLEPQVHGNKVDPPEYLAKNIKFIKNDIRNGDALLEALKDVDIVYHLAALVGIGQSMYQVNKYVDVNTHGTAWLLDILVNEPNSVKKLIVASSMSIYGEGSYICEDCNEVNPKVRGINQFQNKDWEINCPICDKKVLPIPTDEDKSKECLSIYALTKMEQERMCLLIAKTYGINTTALRFFNTYGSRQALSNPYTGVCAIFSSRLLSNKSPLVYEDGNQSRDFVHVKDVCQALLLSMEKANANNEVFNVGTGKPIKIIEIAKILTKYINPRIEPIVTNQYRVGDIRHCYADISKITSKLGYKAKYSFENGKDELIEWVKTQQGNLKDKFNEANEELKKRGLLE